MKTLTKAQQIKIAQKAAEYGKSLLDKGYDFDIVCKAVWNKYGYPVATKNGTAMIYVDHQLIATF